jgi:CubicO group peptidase (beta-lactamase class C family)
MPGIVKIIFTTNSHAMKRLFLFFVLSILLIYTTGHAQSLYFPSVTGDAWDTISPGQLHWQKSNIDSLYSYLASANTKAFILLKDGKIVLEKYFGTFTKDSVWYWASAGKTLTGFAIGLAQQEGKLSVHDATDKYLGVGWTSLTPEKEHAITIWNQLTMTTGLDDMAGDPDCTSPGCLVYKADAGTRWAYHTAPYTLLDSVLLKATGQTVNTFIYQRLHSLTGFSGLFVKSGYNNLYVSTARQMARFGLLLLNKGNWDGHIILTDSAYFRQMTHPSQSLNNSYGYLTWLNGQSSYMIPQTQFVFPGFLSPAAPADMFAALGKNGQFINVVPSQNLVWIRMGDAPDNSLVPFLLNDKIWQRLNLVMNPTAGIEPSTIPGNRPGTFNLSAYPNPFNPSTSIHFNVSGPAQEVHLVLYDVSGRQCRSLLCGERITGAYTAVWDGKDDAGSLLPSGFYICRLTAGPAAEVVKLLLLK